MDEMEDLVEGAVVDLLGMGLFVLVLMGLIVKLMGG